MHTDLKIAYDDDHRGFIRLTPGRQFVRSLWAVMVEWFHHWNIYFLNAKCSRYITIDLRREHWRSSSSQPSMLYESWPDLAKIRHFDKSLQVFGKILTVYFLFGKTLSILCQICDIIGLIFSVANGQILKNNLTIWSHWLHASIKLLIANERAIQHFEAKKLIVLRKSLSSASATQFETKFGNLGNRFV